MKTRTGFVSNSSTSSFVIIGYKVEDMKEFFKKVNPLKYKDLLEEAEKDDYEINDILYDYIYDNCIIEGVEYLTDGYSNFDYVGHLVAQEEDYSLSKNELDSQSIFAIMKEVQEKLNMDETPSLFTGSRGC